MKKISLLIAALSLGNLIVASEQFTLPSEDIDAVQILNLNKNSFIQATATIQHALKHQEAHLHALQIRDNFKSPESPRKKD